MLPVVLLCVQTAIFYMDLFSGHQAPPAYVLPSVGNLCCNTGGVPCILPGHLSTDISPLSSCDLAGSSVPSAPARLLVSLWVSGHLW